MMEKCAILQTKVENHWIMSDGSQLTTRNSGVVFRFDPDGSRHRMIEGVTIANGISWSKDDKTMYFTDSPTQTIVAYDYESASGSISNKRVFFKVDEEGAVPDGHAQDEEGYLWVACHSAWKVVRVSPQGKVVAEISLPTRCPTVSRSTS